MVSDFDNVVEFESEKHRFEKWLELVRPCYFGEFSIKKTQDYDSNATAQYLIDYPRNGKKGALIWIRPDARLMRNIYRKESELEEKKRMGYAVFSSSDADDLIEKVDEYLDDTDAC